MKRKIIYVDFINKRKITFANYLLNKLFHFFSSKFKLKSKSSSNIYSDKKKRLFS